MGHLRGLLADTRPLHVPEYRRLFTAQVITVIGARQGLAVAIAILVWGLSITGSLPAQSARP